MNKPRAIREGFIEDDRPDDPFERDEKPKKTIEPAPPEAPPLPAEDEWPIVIKLQKPIPGEKTGEMITELRMREPSTNDLIKAGGNPCRVEIVNAGTPNATAAIIIDDLRMFKLVAGLSGILEQFLVRLDPRDYSSAAYRLRRFFIPEGKHLW